MGFVIDCIASPTTAAMRAAGVTGLTRYLSWLDRDSLGKVIHQDEYDRLIADGFGVLLNWEYAATDWAGGASAGTTHATEAVRQATALGYPTGRAAIAGSADFDMSLAQWTATAHAYAQSFSAVVRGAGYRSGVYGPYDVLTWCRDAGLMDIYWQAGMSTAWSGGRNAALWPGAHLRQRRQIFIGGVDCDLNDILISDYGQAGLDMEQRDQVAGYKARQGQSIGDLFADQGNLRDELFLPPDHHSLNPPAAGSRFDVIMRAAQAVLAAPPASVTLSDDQLAALVAGISAAVKAAPALDLNALALAVASAVTSSHDALTAADQPLITAAVLDALRAGTNPR